MLLVAVGGVVAVVERELLGARLAVAVRTEKRHPAPVREISYITSAWDYVWMLG